MKRARFSFVGIGIPSALIFYVINENGQECQMIFPYIS